MTASVVRNVLLRTLFDHEFHSTLSKDPKKALVGYDLTDDERSALTEPSRDLYKFLDPSRDLDLTNLFGSDGGAPPPPPTTIVVVIVVAIIVTAAISPLTQPGTISLERLRPLLDSIQSTRGQARFDLIRTLTNELTRDR